MRVMSDTGAVRSDPTGRVLQLLSLLQTHRRWRSAELAAELDVTPRTVRRDIDRLRALGYPVEATPGVDGGYRLAAGAHLPPLMLDDDEAVAIAVGLWSATSAPLDGIEDTALRALAKIESLLPDRIRRRTTAITSNVSTYRWREEQATIDIAIVTTVTAACRDHEELRFAYVSRAGEASDRLVQPHRLVSVDQRWYLLAWDLRRDGWRTFRLDRLGEPRPAGVRFEPRAVPGGDPAAYVADHLGSAPQPYEITVHVEADLEAVHGRVPWLTDSATQRDDGTVDLLLRGGGPAQIATQIARLAASFDVAIVGDDQAERDVREAVRAVATRLGAAT